MYEYLNIKNTQYDISNEIYYKVVYENLTRLIDYISLDRYRNVKILINALKYVDVENLIKLKNKYGYDCIELINNENIKYYLSSYLIKNNKLMNVVDTLYLKYMNSPLCKHFDGFITRLEKNITKLTINNMDDLFIMYVLVCTKRFDGFKRWGPGNNKTPEINLLNHYKKHVLNSKDENWSKYINDNPTCEQYGKFAIDTSRCIKNKIIHTNGINVYLSGLYNKVLIIGRLDDDHLGISSCYIISDINYDKKINVFKNNACFYLLV